MAADIPGRGSSCTKVTLGFKEELPQSTDVFCGSSSFVNYSSGVGTDLEAIHSFKEETSETYTGLNSLSRAKTTVLTDPANRSTPGPHLTELTALKRSTLALKLTEKLKKFAKFCAQNTKALSTSPGLMTSGQTTEGGSLTSLRAL